MIAIDEDQVAFFFGDLVGVKDVQNCAAIFHFDVDLVFLGPFGEEGGEGGIEF